MTASDLRNPNAGRRTIWTAVAATAVATALVVSAIGIWRAPAPAPAFPMRSLHVPPAGQPLLATLAHRDVAISADGRRLAYVGGAYGPSSAQIYLRSLDQLEALPLRGAQPAIAPFFSPDGDWLGFIDQTDLALLKKVSTLGGPPVLVTNAQSAIVGATWTAAGIVFGVRGGPLSRVPASGGAAVPLTSLDAETGEANHAWPAAVPGNDVVLFAITDVSTGRMVSSQLAAVNQASGEIARLNIEGYHPRYISSGHIIYATVDGTLRAVGFDPARMAITAAPVPVLEGVGIKVAGSANFDISKDGHLVFTGAGSAIAERTIAWVDRTGRETPIAAPKRNYFYARVSPDGTRLSVDSRDEEQDIWIWDVRRETLSRLTDKPGPDQYGLWTKDHRVVFSSSVSGRIELFRHRPDGVGQPEQISDAAAEQLMPFPNAVTPDGLQVIFRSGTGAKNDLWIAHVKDKTVRKLLATEHDELNAALSPGGEFMAFESDLSGGRFEIFVRPFPDVEAWQVQVSTEGGQEPVWSPDGREIFYLAGGKLMAVRVTRTGGGIELGKPVPLFDVNPYFFGGAGRNYDVAPDGRFVMVKSPSGGVRSSPITIVMHWIEELRSKVK